MSQLQKVIINELRVNQTVDIAGDPSSGYSSRISKDHIQFSKDVSLSNPNVFLNAGSDSGFIATYSSTSLGTGTTTTNTIALESATTLAAGDLIHISSDTDVSLTGVFVVNSVVNNSTSISIRTTSTGLPFISSSLVSEKSVSVSKVGVSHLKIASNGLWKQARGTNVSDFAEYETIATFDYYPISFTDGDGVYILKPGITVIQSSDQSNYVVQLPSLENGDYNGKEFIIANDSDYTHIIRESLSNGTIVNVSIPPKFSMSLTGINNGIFPPLGEVPVSSSTTSVTISKVSLDDGSVSEPALAFINDTDTGFYRVGEGVIGVAGDLNVSGNLNVSGTISSSTIDTLQNNISNSISSLQTSVSTNSDSISSLETKLTNVDYDTLKDHTFITNLQLNTWTQLGTDIDGEAVNDNIGHSVALSADGTVVAIGARYNDGFYKSNTGHVRIYKWNGNTWVQRGKDIDGENSNDQSGYSVALSSDGSIVAIGATGNDGNGSDSGHVRVYQWDGAMWTQLGADIDGEASLDYSGLSVDLSADGSIVAIGAYGNDGNGSTSGHVRVYQWDGATWNKLGGDTYGDIDGEAAGDHSGWSVALSSDGSIVAIGAIYNKGTNKSNSGHVRVFQWDGVMWNKLGGDIYGDIDGEAASDQSGYSVALSSDGSIVAIGAPFNSGNGSNSGHVRVYQWNSDEQKWNQLGGDINGKASGDNSGYSVALSADGSIVAIGARQNDGNGSNSGHVRVYLWKNNTWNLLGADIDGEASDDNSGWSVALSADGSIVAIGAIYNDGNGLNSGHARIYKYGIDVETSITSLQSKTNAIEYDGSTTSISSALTLGSIYNVESTIDNTVSTLTTHGQNILNNWYSMGSFIPGGHRQQFGYTTDINYTGDTIVVGATGKRENNVNINGYVKVFTWNGFDWYQKGSTLSIGYHGENMKVCISSSGDIVCIGSPRHEIDSNGNTENKGRVQVFEWDSTTSLWVQRGSDIIGNAGEYLGYSVSISGNGNTIAIGKPNLDNTSVSGIIQVYDWTVVNEIGTWVQRGVDIQNTDIIDNLGYSVSLSNDGNILCAGMPISVSPILYGRIQVYEWVIVNGIGNWTLRGGDITIQDIRLVWGNIPIGVSVDISADGSVVATGTGNTINKTQLVVALEWKSDTDGNYSWHQRGVPFTGQRTFGSALSLSSDGNTLLIGEYNADESPSIIDNGYVVTYRWDTILQQWNQLHDRIYGLNSNYDLGYSVGMSGDGTRFIAGGKRGSTQLYEYGEVQVYELSNQITLMNGSHSKPSIAFQNDTDTGIYRASENTIGIVGSVTLDGTLSTSSEITDVDATIKSIQNDTKSNRVWNVLSERDMVYGTYDTSGNRVKCSQDGLTIALCNFYTNTNKIVVYHYTEGSWSMKGSNTISGNSISLSSDGNVLAVGRPYEDRTDNGVTYSKIGLVTIYVWDSATSQWNSRGTDILCPAELLFNNVVEGVTYKSVNYYFGFDVVLAADGNSVAIGASLLSTYDGNTIISSNKGAVFYYTWDPNAVEWVKAYQFVSEDVNDKIGTQIAMSIHENVVTIVTRKSNSVRSFVYDNSVWTEGYIMNENDTIVASTQNVSLSADGKTLVTSFHTYNFNEPGSTTTVFRNGRIYIHEKNDLGQWIETFYATGEVTNDYFGEALSISRDGLSVAVKGGNNTYVRVFSKSLSLNVWFQKTNRITTVTNDFVYDVALSSDGTKLVLGCANNALGHGRVYIENQFNEPIAQSYNITSAFEKTLTSVNVNTSMYFKNDSGVDKIKLEIGNNGGIYHYGDNSVEFIRMYHDGNNAVIRWETGNIYVQRLGSTAGVVLGPDSTSWASASDRKLKKNIQEVEPVLEKLKHIKSYMYNLICEECPDNQLKPSKYGFMADEVEPYFPEVVETIDITENTKALRYTEMVPILCKGIVELDTKCEELTNEVNTLKTENETLKTEVNTLKTTIQDILTRLAVLEQQ